MDEKNKSIVDNDSEAVEVQPRLRYPRSVAFIVGNEFCERFSYYGMKAILVLYFTNILHYDDDSATEYYHIFAMACYFTPILGAIIADSILGKFRTIFYISILYALGNVVLSLASYWENMAITWIGLTAIALGTGGIKPCVSAFGGDQFKPGQETQLKQFFSIFYISINGGSLLSTFITPILREDVHCFGNESCFPLAFGVPAVLMVVALLLFLLGKLLTDYVIVPPSKGNIVVQVVTCVFTALSRKMFTCIPKRNHWLDYADDKCDAKTLEDIKAVMRVLLLYVPLPIFWALFDQTGSRWTLQANKMDGHFVGDFDLKPDQIQVVNPLLIILMIPVFEYGIYPLLSKFNLLKKPLQRMITGGILAAVSFAICGIIQLKIESELGSEADKEDESTDTPAKKANVNMLWQVVQYFVITCGEIMFSITGLEFSYSQAPKSMKSVLQAAWLFTVAIGNLIVVIISSARIFDKISYELFFFAGLMVLDMVGFAILAYYYVPYKGNTNEGEESEDQKAKTNGHSNNQNGVNREGFADESTKF